MARRDLELERALLEPLDAISPGFAARVIARLDRSGRDLGREHDTPDMPVPAILAEAQEEALDIAGWGVMALQTFRHLKSEDLLEHATRLAEAFTLAARADAVLDQLRREHSTTDPVGLVDPAPVT